MRRKSPLGLRYNEAGLNVEKESTKTPSTVPPPVSPESASLASHANDIPASGVRYATDEQFRKAQRKTSALHAGLFRRLSK